MSRRQENRGTTETVVAGWGMDQPLDVVPGEHGIMLAMLERAWHDAQLDLDGIPEPRREEAFAAKLSACEWLISDDEDYLMSFRSVCLHLDLDAAHARQIMLRGVKIPSGRMPEKWAKEFASVSRESQPYIKHGQRRARSASMPILVIETASIRPPNPGDGIVTPIRRPVLVEAVPAPTLPYVVVRSSPTEVVVPCPEPPCPELDEIESTDYSLEALLAEINVRNAPDADGVDWAAAAEPSAEPEEGG